VRVTIKQSLDRFNNTRTQKAAYVLTVTAHKVVSFSAIALNVC